jgi:hypothetical protein
MANFSKVIKDHNEMRKTITQLEAVKKRIKAQQREQNPPDEFALRNNTSALGQVGFEGNQIVDDVVKDTGTMNVEMLLKTLFRGIESTFLNPLNANNLWERMRNSIPQNTPVIQTAHLNLTRLLKRLSSKASFTIAEIQMVKVSIEQLLSELFPNIPNPPNVYNYNQYGPGNAPGPNQGNAVEEPDVPLLYDSTVMGQPLVYQPLAYQQYQQVGSQPVGSQSATMPGNTPPAGSLSWASLEGSNPNSQTGPSIDPLVNNTVVAPLPPDVADDMNALLASLGVSRDDISLQFQQQDAQGVSLPNSLPQSYQEYDTLLESLGISADDISRQFRQSQTQQSRPQSYQEYDVLLESLGISRDDISRQFNSQQEQSPPRNQVPSTPIPNTQSLSPDSLMFGSQVPFTPIQMGEINRSEEIQLNSLIQFMSSPPQRPPPPTPQRPPPPPPPPSTPPPSEQEPFLAGPGGQTLLTKKQATDALQKIANNKNILRNDVILPGYEKSLDAIGNVLEKNMNLKTKGVRLNADRIIYQQWAKIIYLGAIMFEDDDFEQNINNNEIPMKEVVEWLMNEQNKRTNSSGLSAVNKDFIVDLFFTGGQDFKTIRLGMYSTKQASIVPGTSSMGAAAGTKSGKGLKHTGLKTVKQIISRTENLIQAANLGNKSTEVRNELDTLLSVLIDRKEVRPQFRTNLMKKLF